MTSRLPAYLRQREAPPPLPTTPVHLVKRYHVVQRVSTFRIMTCNERPLSEDEALADFNALRGFYRDMGFQVRAHIDGVVAAFVVEHNGRLLCSAAIVEAKL